MSENLSRQDASFIALDRMRFIKNTTSSRLTLLAILLNVFFFVSIYKSDVSGYPAHKVGNYYYNILIGASIIYNLVFMLTAFLCSEGTKNYKKNFSWVLIVLGVIQVARIFIYPVQAHAATFQNNLVMETPQFIRTIIYLVGSAACLIVAALVNLRKSGQLSAHMASLEAKKA